MSSSLPLRGPHRRAGSRSAPPPGKKTYRGCCLQFLVPPPPSVSARCAISTTCSRTRWVCWHFSTTWSKNFAVASDYVRSSFRTCRVNAVIEVFDWVLMAAISLSILAMMCARSTCQGSHAALTSVRLFWDRDALHPLCLDRHLEAQQTWQSSSPALSFASSAPPHTSQALCIVQLRPLPLA